MRRETCADASPSAPPPRRLCARMPTCTTSLPPLLPPLPPQVARAYADMHDKPARMLAKGVLSGVVPWQQSRRFFAHRLERRLLEASWALKVADGDCSLTG